MGYLNICIFSMCHGWSWCKYPEGKLSKAMLCLSVCVCVCVRVAHPYFIRLLSGILKCLSWVQALRYEVISFLKMFISHPSIPWISYQNVPHFIMAFMPGTVLFIYIASFQLDQGSEIILGLYKCNYSLTVKELKLHLALWRQLPGWCGPPWKWIQHPCAKHLSLFLYISVPYLGTF